MKKEYNFKSMTIMQVFPDHVNSKDIIRCVKKLSDKVTETPYGKLSLKISDEMKLIDLKILWEKREKVKRMILNDFGEVEDKYIDDVELSEIRIWTLPEEGNFIFVFLKNTTFVKADKVLKYILSDLNLSRVRLNNYFFDDLTKHHIPISLINKTITIGTQGTDSYLYDYSENYNRYEVISEATMILHLYGNTKIKIKISNNGVIKLFNRPDFEQVYEIVKFFNSQLIDYLKSGGSTYE